MAQKVQRVPPKPEGSPLVSTPNRIPDQWLKSGHMLNPSTAEVIERLKKEGKL